MSTGAGRQAGRLRREAAARRDVNIAGRDQFVVNIGVAGAGELAVPGLLPRDVPGFTGRAGEMDRLVALAEGGSVVVTAIGGTAGVGKTSLAVHAAYRLLPRFPDGHLYVDLRGYTEGQVPAEPGEVLEVFLRRLGVAAEEMPAGMEERSGLLRQRLAERRVLMLLDNAWSEAQVRPLLPGAGGSLVLITSRSVLAGLEVDDRIGLDVLAEDEATALLAGLIGPDRAVAEPQAVGQVRDWCGRLPLALRIAGQLLAVHPAWPVARLAGLLADERDRLGRLSAGDLQVRAAFAVSYRQLDDGDARLFRLLGLHPGPDFGPASAAGLAAIDRAAAEAMLDRLAMAHLVTEKEAGRFGMHDLLHLFARQTCQEVDDQDTRDAAQGRLVGYYTELAGTLNSCLDPRPRLGMTEANERSAGSLPSPRQALALFESVRPSLLAALGLAAQRGWDQQARQLSESMSQSLTLLRYLDDLLTVQKAALAAARHAGDTAAESRAQNNLGNAYRELRRFEEAIASFQESIAACREAGDRFGEGRALCNLGTVSHGLRRFEEAITYYQQSLAACRESGDRLGEGRALNGLGSAYDELRRFEEAITCFQQSLAACRESGDRLGEGHTLGNFGKVYRELRRFEEAVTCYQDALVILREIGDRYNDSNNLNGLGLAYVELRRFDEAVTYYQDALAAYRETGDRLGEGVTLNNLGNAYLKLRQFDEAVTYYQDALAASREIGDRHGEGLALNNLGIAYLGRGQLKDAIACYRDALVIKRESGDRLGEGQTFSNLGDAHQGLQQPDQAAICWRDAAAAMRDVGEDQEAARLEQQAANVRRRRWRRSS